MDLKFWPFYTRILFSGLLLISPTQPLTTKYSGIYTLYLYELNAASESLATTYYDAIRKCNKEHSRLVVRNESKAKIIIDYIIGRGKNSLFWVHGRGEDGCSAYDKNGRVPRPCSGKHFYVCEQAQANSVKLTKSHVSITDKGTTITCTASGYPIPHITWKRNGTEISMSVTESLFQTKSSDRSILYLKNLNVTDEGQYICQATNSYRSDTYTSSASEYIKVPSTPTNISVTGYSCNSSLSIKWKPHFRAIGVKHKVTFRKLISNDDITIYKTPIRDTVQNITANSLPSSSQFSIKIQPCSKPQECYPYVASVTAMTGGVVGQVSNAKFKKENGTCKVSWSPPIDLHPNATITLYQLHIASSLVYAPQGVKMKLSRNTTFVNASLLSYLIPKLPNRNYSVYIQAETCAGLGDKTLTSGECVTDASAPASVPQPELQNKNFDIGNETLEIYFPYPSETNGLISCVFIVVNSKYHIDKNNAEYLLRELDVENSTSGTGHIAIAADRNILQNHKTQGNYAEILRFTLGDESTTECDMKNEDPNGKRTTESNNSTDVITGINKRLVKNKQYQIIVITSTPSGSEILFQVSKKLDLNYSTIQVTDNSQIILISVGVVVFIAVLLLALYLFFIRRRKNWRFKEPSIANDVRRSDTGFNNRANSFESVEETEEFPEQFGNETTDIDTVAMPEIEQRIVTPISCNEPEVTKPDDPYENFKSDTTVTMNELKQYFKKHAEDNNALFLEQYQAIKSKSRENMKSTEVASQPDFKQKNRYKNILPFDSTRVILKGNATGYINACYIDGFQQRNKYISTQGPLSSTVVDFWLMVIEHNCKAIVMLSKCSEGGKKKCFKYWPDLDASLTFGSSIVENVEEVKCGGFVRRTFRIYVNTDEREMEVIQYQYLAWPDHGVPFTTSNLVRMQKTVKVTIQETDGNYPLLVHCSAGAGRSGTYIGYDILLEEAESLNTIDLYSCVMKMRSQRIDMIQTCDQYILLHKLILERYTFSETDFPTNGIMSHFQELISDKYVLSSNFEVLANLVHAETTETNARSRATIRKNGHYSAQRNVLFIPPEHGEFNSPQIDAYWIEAYDEDGLMIAARDPTESTANLFWRGVLYNKANTIIMLSDDQECFQYWPPSIESIIKIGSVTVTLLEQAIDGAIIERSLKVCGEYGEITVTHFQCTDWDANGCPKNGRSVLKLVEEMRLKVRQNVGYASLIHCSDGVGRTGTFCTVVNLIDRLKNEGRVDVFSAVKDLRDCKRGMVQTLDQYVFCHQVIIDYLKTFELYSNFE